MAMSLRRTLATAALPFWDRRYRRLRALWRLALFLLSRSLMLMGLGALATLLHLWDAAPALVSVSISALATLLPAYLCARWLDRRSHRALGLPPSRINWAEFGLGLALGAVMMALAAGVGLACGWLRPSAVWAGYAGPASAALPLVVWLLVGVHEEVWARGYLLANLAEGLNVRWLSPRWALLLAWVGTSAYFGLLHADNPSASLTSTLAIVAAGLLLGLGVILTGRLGLAVGVHIAWNLFQGTVFGLPVSGYRLSPFSLLRLEAVGPSLWTGGAFGPEAGLLGALGLLTGLAGTVLIARRRCGRLSLATTLTTPSLPEATGGD